MIVYPYSVHNHACLTRFNQQGALTIDLVQKGFLPFSNKYCDLFSATSATYDLRCNFL